MPPVGRVLGRGVALALAGNDVDQGRPVGADLDGAQHRQELVHVVPVDRADIAESQLLEERAAEGEALHQILGALRPLLERAGQERHRALGRGLEILERRAGVEAAEIARHGAGRGRDRHLVVVEDHDQSLAEVACVVHRLIGHAGGHGAVADHRDGVPDGPRRAQIARDAEAERGAD